ncbi:hypothetical protein OROGR_025290 [Orobanche gracilis]
MATSLFVTRRALATHLSRRSRFAVPLLSYYHNKENQQDRLQRFTVQTRLKTSGPGYSPLNDPSPNWSNRPPKETILLDGCDYEHWLIVMEFNSDPKPTEEEMIGSYVKTLASVVGSEEEAKKKIYSVSTTTYTGFGALISEELSYKVKGVSPVFYGYCPIRILMFPTRTMEVISLSMGKSFIGHNIDLVEHQTRVGGPGQDMIGVAKQCRYRGESHCREKMRPQISNRIRGNQQQLGAIM